MARDEQGERTRTRILDATREVLVDRGYHGLSMAGIAAAADLTRVTVYRRFGSKVELLSELADRLVLRSGVAVSAAAALADPDPRAGTSTLVEALCELWAADRALMRRLVGLAEVDPEVGAVIVPRERWRHAQVATMVERLAAAGAVREPGTATSATALLVAVTGFPACDQAADVAGVGLREVPALLAPAVRAVLA